jgi:hypothetical protein
MSPFRNALARALVAAALLPLAPVLCAAGPHEAMPSPSDMTVRVPAQLAVRKELGAPPAGVTELKFRDVFKLPVGPKGLQPTEKLLSLDGKRVRIVGYMAQQESPSKGAFLLSALPVLLGEEDESLADDLPASSILVELPKSRDVLVPPLPGLLQLTGTLRVGMRADPASGRATAAQLVLDPAPERALRRIAQTVAKNSHKPR